MTLSVKQLSTCCLVCFLIIWGFPAQSKAQKCEAQGRHTLHCRELANLQEMNSIGNLTRLRITNEQTELIIGDANSVEGIDSLTNLDLSQVKHLQLQESAFTPLANLRYLNISGCALEELKATHFDAESTLQQLDASYNELTTLTKDFFARLQKLIYANFTHNALNQVEVPSMPLLEQLELSHNELINVSLGMCPNLRKLTLNDNLFKQLDATSFRELRGLLNLQLDANAITEIGKDTFQPLMKLLTLNLSQNALEALRPQVFGSSAVQISPLRHLDLSNNNIRLLFDNQFRLLDKLQMLDLSHNSLATLNRLNFVGLQSLRKLYLQSNDIFEIKEHTFAELEDLDTIDLSYNNLEYLGESIFGSKTLPRLRKLNLNANSLKRLHALAFSSLPFMEYLSLGNNQLPNLDVRMFAPMRHLQKLHLGHNLLSNLDVDVLESLSSVLELLIDNNKLTNLPQLNGTLPNLKRVAIEGNPWQCPCFNQLERWLQVRRISYLRQGVGYYSGEKPLCVVTPSEDCLQSLPADAHQNVVDEFEDHLKGTQSERNTDED